MADSKISLTLRMFSWKSKGDPKKMERQETENCPLALLWWFTGEFGYVPRAFLACLLEVPSNLFLGHRECTCSKNCKIFRNVAS